MLFSLPYPQAPSLTGGLHPGYPGVHLSGPAWGQLQGKRAPRGLHELGAEAEKPRVRPGLRTGPRCAREAEREVLAQRRPPTTSLPGHSWAGCLGAQCPLCAERACMEGKGPRVKVSGFPGRGGSQVWLLEQRRPRGAGDGQGGGPQPLKKEGSRDRGRRGLVRPDARDSSSPVSICPGGSRGQETHEKEASPCGGKDRVQRPRSLPSPDGPRDHSIWGGRGRRLPCLPGAGSFLPSGAKGDPRSVPGPPCPRGAPGLAGGYTFLGFRPTW